MSVDCDVYKNKLQEVYAYFKSEDCNIRDDTYLAKLLAHLSNKGIGETLIQLPASKEFVEFTLESTKISSANPAIVGFALKLSALILCDEKRFKLVKSENHLFVLIDELASTNCFENSYVKVSYLVLATSLLSHDAGTAYVIQSGLWKKVLEVSKQGRNIYIARKSENFFAVLLNKSPPFVPEEYVCILTAVLEPFLLARIDSPASFPPSTNSEDLFLQTLQLACKILEESLSGSCIYLSKFLKDRKFESLLFQHLDVHEEIHPVQTIAKLLCLIYFNNVATANIEAGDVAGCIDILEEKILFLFLFLLEKECITVLVRTCMVCHGYWEKVKGRIKEVPHLSKLLPVFQDQLFYVQITPIYGYITKCCDNRALEEYGIELSKFVKPQTKRLSLQLRDAIVHCKLPEHIVRDSVLAVEPIKELLGKEKAVQIYQLLMMIINEFSSESSCGGDILRFSSLLCTALDCIMSLTDCYPISAQNNLPSMNVLAVVGKILSNPNTPVTVSVRVLRLVRSENLLFNLEDENNVGALCSSLNKRMHDPHWEIKDSVLEVVEKLCSLLPGDEFRSLQNVILENGLCELALVAALEDEESYIRTSAINCLAAMIQVPALWDNCLAKEELVEKVLHILKEESEGNVRTAAVNMLRKMHIHKRLSQASSEDLHKAMVVVADDLHWEVKIHVLEFWEKVIGDCLEEQGIVYEHFTKDSPLEVECKEEVQNKMKMVLDSLSKMGCLKVLVNALADCDLNVVKKTVSILIALKEHLIKCDLVRVNELSIVQDDIANSETCCSGESKTESLEGANCDKCEFKDKEMDEDTGNDEVHNKIIDEIVGDRDINLLKNVRRSTELPNIEHFEHVVKSSEKSVTASVFLEQISSLDLPDTLENRIIWISRYTDDLLSLLDDILLSFNNRQSNAMDCY